MRCLLLQPRPLWRLPRAAIRSMSGKRAGSAKGAQPMSLVFPCLANPGVWWQEGLGSQTSPALIKGDRSTQEHPSTRQHDQPVDMNIEGLSDRGVKLPNPNNTR